MKINTFIKNNKLLRLLSQSVMRYIPKYKHSPLVLHMHFSRDQNKAGMCFENGAGIGKFNGGSYMMLARPVDYIENEILKNSNWEPHILNLIDIFLRRSGSVMADIGANIGASTIPLATLRPTNRFVCFEAHPKIYSRLRDNITINRLENVECVNAAVSELNDSFVEFYAQKVVDENNSNLGLSSLRKNADISEHEVIKIKSITLDSYWEDSRLDVVKIDTQGAELRVLNGMKDLLKRFRPAVFFEFEEHYFDPGMGGAAREDITRLFLELEYDLFAIHPNKALHFYPKLNLSHPYNGDILALPRYANL